MFIGVFWWFLLVFVGLSWLLEVFGVFGGSWWFLVVLGVSWCV